MLYVHKSLMARCFSFLSERQRSTMFDLRSGFRAGARKYDLVARRGNQFLTARMGI